MGKKAGSWGLVMADPRAGAGDQRMIRLRIRGSWGFTVKRNAASAVSSEGLFTSFIPAAAEAGRNRQRMSACWREGKDNPNARTRHGTAAVTKQEPQRDQKRTATTELT